MSLAPLVFLLLTAAPPAAPLDTGGAEQPRAVVDEGGIPGELLAIAEAVRDRPLGERMAAISAPLLGVPYVNDAAGEGRAPDFDPPARYDAFDCLTFVEEILALALPADPRSAPLVRNRLRYRPEGPLAYANRNHFMLEEWIPHNIANGLLVDITAELGEVALMEKVVSPSTWSGWRKRSLFALPDARLPAGTFELPVMPLAEATDAMDRIPDGALILTVRQSRSYVPIVVTHLGFKVPGSPEVPLMRHATRMGSEPRVRDERLRWYLEHVRWYHRWPVAGISVLMPQEQGPRVSLLASPEAEPRVQ